ncbi:LOW QUALITY PROTEIN: hypothetical protein V1477_004969 [Vespula maculifrons]|uniref:Uncharacterized protein n=1 Tax=Vespula maculifrons TaxID=7453 RepID=A0ABD2CP70_VESMC
MVVSLPLLLLLDGYYGDGNWVFLECIPCPDYRPLTIVLPLLPAIQANGAVCSKQIVKPLLSTLCKKGADRPAPQGWFYSLEVTDICGCRKEKKVLGFIKIKFDKVIKITLTHDEHILFTRIIFTGYKSLTQQHASYGNACHPEQSVPSRNFVLTEITFEEGRRSDACKPSSKSLERNSRILRHLNALHLFPFNYILRASKIFYFRNTGIVDFREKLSRSRFNLAAEKIRPIITKSGFANYHDDGVIYGHMADVSWKRATDCSRVSIEEARALKRSRKRKS